MMIFMPTREQVQSLKVGDFALDCFGKMREVVEVYAQKDDIIGRAFVCYYTKTSETSSTSMSMKEDEIVRTADLCNKYKSAEIDAIERQMRVERKQVSA